MPLAAALRGEQGVKTECVRVTDYFIRSGSGMNEDDEWPQLLEKITATDILAVPTPLWPPSPDAPPSMPKPQPAAPRRHLGQGFRVVHALEVRS